MDVWWVPWKMYQRVHASRNYENDISLANVVRRGVCSVTTPLMARNTHTHTDITHSITALLRLLLLCVCVFFLCTCYVTYDVMPTRWRLYYVRAHYLQHVHALMLWHKSRPGRCARGVSNSFLMRIAAVATAASHVWNRLEKLCVCLCVLVCVPLHNGGDGNDVVRIDRVRCDTF